MKNCIYSLIRGYTNLNNYDTLLKRNSAIENNLFKILLNNVDYILFHEGNITIEHQKYIQEKTNITLKFIEISFNNNDKEVYTNDKGYLESKLFDERTKLTGSSTNERPWGLNYRHMCHFYFVDILEYLKDYKYALRIDEDCIIKNKYNYFNLFNNSNFKLISGKYVHDSKTATINLSEFSKNFILQNKLNVNYSFDIGGPYTNVLLLDIEYFRNHQLINKYVNLVSKEKKIFIYRWGDLPLWGEICKIFLNKNEYNYYNKNISYYHGSHGEKVNLSY